MSVPLDELSARGEEVARLEREYNDASYMAWSEEARQKAHAAYLAWEKARQAYEKDVVKAFPAALSQLEAERERPRELEAALKACAAVLGGHNMTKSGLTRALEMARDALKDSLPIPSPVKKDGGADA